MLGGIDEAGRGPVLGPLVMAIVCIKPENESKLINLGVKDSKLLKPEIRNALFQQIIDISEHHEIIAIQPKEIDDALISVNLNINKLEAKISAKLIANSNSSKVILDCPTTNYALYKSYIKKFLGQRYNEIEVVAENKADVNYPVVSAASILAKVTRDRLIEDLKKRHKIDFGSGYSSDPLTQKFIEENWENKEYAYFIRKRWETFKRLDEDKKQMRLI